MLRMDRLTIESESHSKRGLESVVNTSKEYSKKGNEIPIYSGLLASVNARKHGSTVVVNAI